VRRPDPCRERAAAIGIAGVSYRDAPLALLDRLADRPVEVPAVDREAAGDDRLLADLGRRFDPPAAEGPRHPRG
jgi:hypothetical protein